MPKLKSYATTCLLLYALIDPIAIARAGEINTQLAARYVREKVSGGTSEPVVVERWWLFTSAARVERYVPAKAHGDVWMREADGQIYYQRLFHGERCVIEYSPSDLAALGRRAGWQSAGRMVSSEALARMNKRETGRMLDGRRTTAYESIVQGVRTVIHWLDEEQLPALISVEKEGVGELVRLEWIGPVRDAAVTPPDSSKYLRIDHADVGDHASDPLIKRVLSQLVD